MRRALFAICSTVVGLVLLLSFKSQATSVTTPPAAIATPTPGATGSTGAASPGGAAATTGSGTGTRTITGASADTRWGPVQVQITVTNGTLTAATAVVYPQNNQRDVEINQFAIPQLNQEATAARSANIDFVSGATFTSQGYVQSLQSALDQAGL